MIRTRIIPIIGYFFLFLGITTGLINLLKPTRRIREYAQMLQLYEKINDRQGQVAIPAQRYAEVTKERTGWTLNLVGLAPKSFSSHDSVYQLAPLSDGRHEHITAGWYCLLNNLFSFELDAQGNRLKIIRHGYFFILEPGRTLTLGKSLFNEMVVPEMELVKKDVTWYIPDRWLEFRLDKARNLCIEPLKTPGQERWPAIIEPKTATACSAEEKRIIRGIIQKEGRTGQFEEKDDPLLMVKMVNLPRGQIGLYVIFPGYDFEGLIRLDGHTPWDNWLAKKVVSSKEDLVFSPLNSLGRAVPLNTFSEWSIREKLLYDITYHAAMFHDNPTEKRVEHVIFNKNGEPVTPKNQMLKLHTVSLKAREIPPEKGKLLAANRQAFPFLTNSDLTDKIFINWPKRQRLPNGQAPANPRATVFRTILVLTQIGVEPIPAFQKAFPSSSRELKQGKWSNIGVYSAPIVILKNGQVDGIYHCEDDASEACAQKLSLRKVAYSLSDPNAVVLEFRYHGQQSETDTGMELFYAGRDSGVAINGLPLRDGDSQKLQWHDRLRLFEGTNVEETQKEWELRCNFGTLNYIEQVISANGYNSSSHSPVDDGELLTRLLGLWDVKSGGLNGLITFTPIRSLLDSGQDLRTTLNSDLIEIAASVTRKHLKMLNQAYPYKEKGPGIPTEHGCSVVILNRQGKIRSLLSFPYLTRADVFREDRVAVDFQNWTTHIRGLNMTKNEYPGSIFKIVTSLCWLLDHNDIDIKPGAPHFTVNNYKEWSIVDGDDVAIPDFKCWQGCATYPAYNSNSIFYAFSLPPTGIRCIGNHQSKSAANPDHMTHLSEILFKSCNQGAMTLWASRSYPGILPGSWIETYKSLGFDVKTGAYEDESYLQFGGRWGRELTKHLDFRPGKLDIAGKTDADFARMSFGQMVELPLIHLALIGEQLLNGGTMYLPRFIASKDEEEEDEAFRWIGFDRNKVDRACRWLAGTLTLGSARVKKPESGRVFYGTSYFSFYQQPDVFAGKTSTVEISTAKDSRSDTKEVDTRPMHLRPHSRWLGWQTGELHDGPNKSFEFVPESTELVIAVSIENSSQPPYKAVDLASKIAGAAMEFYGDFNRKLEQECN